MVHSQRSRVVLPGPLRERIVQVGLPGRIVAVVSLDQLLNLHLPDELVKVVSLHAFRNPKQLDVI